jgi:bifunctional non-homologous end joining protein LigD
VSLEEYRRRRDFSRTREPAARAARRGEGAAQFVIQLHHARARHFDFRLELDGVLKSWAVPKGPSLRAGERRLAVQVEDHPLDYGDFEGEIPKGEYGGGHVRIVERGQWQPAGDAEQGLAAGKLDFELQGTHLHGAWTLVRTGPERAKANWLLIKRSDAHARDTDLDALVTDGSEASTDPASGMLRARALALPGARLGPVPPEPQLATARDAAPSGDGWLHEIKWDGYRLIALREAAAVRLQSRNGVDWSGRFPQIEAALRALPLASILLDSELVALQANGHSDFSLLQRALEGRVAHPVSCVAFDLLELDGVDLRGVALLSRKTLLEAVLAAAPSPWIAYGRHLVGHGARVFAKALAAGHEGIVSKRIDAPYRAGRSQDWIKLKRRDGVDAVVVGYTAPKGARQGLGALLLAVEDGDGYRYVGRVGSGIDDAMLKRLAAALAPLATSQAAVEIPAHVPLSPRQVHWVEPRLIVEVDHRGWGKEGLLRHASFRRLREDRRAEPAAPAASRAPRLTHPERVVYPDAGLTKRDVARYYAAVAPWLLQELARRPLSLLRAPDGIDGERFFQKHASAGMGQHRKSIAVREASGRRRAYLVVEDAQDLLALVQMNALEFHPWGARPHSPERPDRITFDLDPGDGVAWRDVVGAAIGIREHLAAVGLRSYPLLSGGKGAHVFVPLGGEDGWPAVKQFARALAQVRAQDDPGHLVAVARKAERRGRIFIDWLRNSRGATSIAPWSLRARPGAPVAMPVSWRDFEIARSADAFRLPAVLDEAPGWKRHPWGDYRAKPQALPRGSVSKSPLRRRGADDRASASRA